MQYNYTKPLLTAVQAGLLCSFHNPWSKKVIYEAWWKELGQGSSGVMPINLAKVHLAQKSLANQSVFKTVSG